MLPEAEDLLLLEEEDIPSPEEEDRHINIRRVAACSSLLYVI